MPQLGTVEVAITFATSIFFLIPGYLIVKFLQSIQEAKTLDSFELSIQSLIYSLFITALWLYFSAEGNMVIKSVQNYTVRTDISKFLYFSFVSKSVFKLTLITMTLAFILGCWRYYGIYWWIIKKLRFTRLNSYITTWEELADLSKGKWVSVELNNGDTYIGLIHSMTHHPFHRELILTVGNENIQIFRASGVHGDIAANYVLISGNEIKTLGVFPPTRQ